jgi:hypothetical protein
VLAWVVIWFVLGYAMYAMAYGALGLLASRAEDAFVAAGPASYILIGSYWLAFAVVATDPHSGWSTLVSIFPVTAPFAMPGRIALGAAAWWEPLLATAVAVATIGGLVMLASRVYTGAILHTGATLKLREAWHSTTRSDVNEAPRTRRLWWRRLRLGGGRGESPAQPATKPDRWTTVALVGFALVLAVLLFTLTHDVILGLVVGLAFYGITSRVDKARHALR